MFGKRTICGPAFAGLVACVVSVFTVPGGGAWATTVPPVSHDPCQDKTGFDLDNPIPNPNPLLPPTFEFVLEYDAECTVVDPAWAGGQPLKRIREKHFYATEVTTTAVSNINFEDTANEYDIESPLRDTDKDFAHDLTGETFERAVEILGHLPFNDLDFYRIEFVKEVRLRIFNLDTPYHNLGPDGHEIRGNGGYNMIDLSLHRATDDLDDEGFQLPDQRDWYSQRDGGGGGGVPPAGRASFCEDCFHDWAGLTRGSPHPPNLARLGENGALIDADLAPGVYYIRFRYTEPDSSSLPTSDPDDPQSYLPYSFRIVVPLPPAVWSLAAACGLFGLAAATRRRSRRAASKKLREGSPG